jgi:hypothetical protein
MKRCHKCKIEQPLDNFVNNKNSKDGKHSACKSCVKIYQQSVKDKLRAYQQKYQSVYRTEHKEELLTYLKEYQKEYQPSYKQENYGDLLAYQQEWKAANKDKCIAYAKKSLAKPEVMAKKRAYMKEYNKLWRTNNPEKWKESVKKYNAKLKAKRQNGQ